MHSTDGRVRVRISDGMFSSERVVELETSDGLIQIFVSCDQLDEVNSTMKVCVLDQDERSALVRLPSPENAARVDRALMLA